MGIGIDIGEHQHNQLIFRVNGKFRTVFAAPGVRAGRRRIGVVGVFLYNLKAEAKTVSTIPDLQFTDVVAGHQLYRSGAEQLLAIKTASIEQYLAKVRKVWF